MFVIRTVGGRYRSKRGDQPDINKARVFARRCDAGNSLSYHPLAGDKVVEVKLTEVSE